MRSPTRRTALAIALALAAVAGVRCARSASLSREDLARLSTAGPIPVAWAPSPAPYVDCPSDEGEKLWERGFGARRGSASVVPAAWGGGGGTWLQIENAYTERLRQDVPVDPAAATAAAFAADARSGPGALRFAEAAERAPAGAPPGGGSPYLLVETTRAVLVGCFFAYQPWFNARASLVDGATGRVLWRRACGGMYPGGEAPPERTREELEWNGGAIYRGDLERRARGCAAELLRGLAPERAGARR